MFDNIYRYFPLIGFFVYLRPRYRWQIGLLFGVGLITSWLVVHCGLRTPWFVHVCAILEEGLYVLFIRHVVVEKSRIFTTEVPFLVWVSGVATVTVFAIAVTASIYIHGLLG